MTIKNIIMRFEEKQFKKLSNDKETLAIDLGRGVTWEEYFVYLFEQNK